MFSGHTVVLVLFGLYWYEVVPSKRDGVYLAMRSFLWSLTPLGLWTIIANRAHYTVDVVIAIYVSVGVWLGFTHFWDKGILQRQRLGSLTHPHLVKV